MLHKKQPNQLNLYTTETFLSKLQGLANYSTKLNTALQPTKED